MRVLVVDDNAVVREALRMLLENERDINVVGEAENGAEAIDLARELRPEIIIMDVNMPVMNGVDATRIIHAEAPQICIIGMSMYERTEQAATMRKAGAMRYVEKNEELLPVLRACYRRAGESTARKRRNTRATGREP